MANGPRQDQFLDVDIRAILGTAYPEVCIVPHCVVRLQHEVFTYHPKLVEQIVANADLGEQFEVHIGSIAAYCNIMLDSDKDGEYDTEQLVNRLLGVLEGSRVLGWMGQDGYRNMLEGNRSKQ